MHNQGSDSNLLVCPVCQKRLRIRPELAGKRVRCPNRACATIIDAPAQTILAPDTPRTFVDSHVKQRERNRLEGLVVFLVGAGLIAGALVISWLLSAIASDRYVIAIGMFVFGGLFVVKGIFSALTGR